MAPPPTKSAEFEVKNRLKSKSRTFYVICYFCYISNNKIRLTLETHSAHLLYISRRE